MSGSRKDAQAQSLLSDLPWVLGILKVEHAEQLGIRVLGSLQQRDHAIEDAVPYSLQHRSSEHLHSFHGVKARLVPHARSTAAIVKHAVAAAVMSITALNQ